MELQLAYKAVGVLEKQVTAEDGFELIGTISNKVFFKNRFTIRSSSR
jgi:hypothetical protein